MPAVTIPDAVSASLAAAAVTGPVELHDEAGRVLGEFVPRRPPPADGGPDPPSRWLDEDPPGTTGDPQHTDPESIAAWIAEYRALPASDLTDEEYAAFKALLAEKKAEDTAMSEARMDALIRRYNG
ncbi:MAG: hypothetical protein K2X82_20425 [Gemmataceae bacterium]|nr:hypothetical protein [Gemmataceae bacterium]